MEYPVIGTMNTVFGHHITSKETIEILLVENELFKLNRNSKSTQIICQEGTLWVTREGDVNDHTLMAGESLLVENKGSVIIQGLPFGVARIASGALLN